MLFQDSLTKVKEENTQSTFARSIQATTFEIHSLSHQVVSLLSSQQSELDVIGENIDSSLGYVSAGNEFLQKTLKEKPLGFRIVVLYILLFTFALLYLDWLNK